MRSTLRRATGKVGPYFFILPAVVLNLVFFIYPFLQSLVMSFYDWPVLGNHTFLGFGNYVTLLQDDMFWRAMGFTLKYALIVTPALFVLAFLLALFVNKVFRGVTIFRTVFFAPVVISMTCCSLVWLWIYNDLYGVLNYILTSLGILKEPILWMNSSGTALTAVVFMVTWKMAGFSMLIILSAFQSVDTQVYEAAAIDGAGKVRTFFRVTVPIIRSYIALAMIISVMGSVLAFEQFVIMTKGGPAYSTTTIVHYIYTSSFNYFKLGYGSAMTMMLLIVLGALSFIQFKFLRSPEDE